MSQNYVSHHSRRQFLTDVGRGMLLAGLGAELAGELGVAPAWADDLRTDALNFGELEPLVALMQETPPDSLMSALVQKLRTGVDLKTLTAAGALANARTFGGEDYIGFHTFMALAPAFRMAKHLPQAEQPLPVLKVLYRNSARIQAFGGRDSEVLHAAAPVALPTGAHPGELLRAASRKGDVNEAEGVFAALADGPLQQTFHYLQFPVDDEFDVHRVVLAWRSWETREIVGERWAHCLLRQSVRYCAQTERRMLDKNYPTSTAREAVPKLLDQYHLVGAALGDKQGDDAWLAGLADTVFRGSRGQAADAVAQSLRDGYAPNAIGEALSLAANKLLLHDPGRIDQWASEEKPTGSCHGDSVGVHASDAASAWRNIVGACPASHVAPSLLFAAYHTGGQGERSADQPYRLAEHLADVTATDPSELLAALDEAVRGQQQYRAAAIAQKYGEQGHEPDTIFSRLLRYATSEDGALHAEKYFDTARAEFAIGRQAFRWGQAVALARVTASEYGRPAPGHEQARQLLGL